MPDAAAISIATLNLSITEAAAQPIYRQLSAQLRRLISERRLHPGDRLPSSRKLAAELGISRTATLNAYDQLIAEGLLVTRPAAGTFVTAGQHGANAGQHRHSTPEPLRAGGLPAATAEASAAFDSGPAIEQFPFRDWAGCLSRVWRRPDPNLLRDRHPGGYWPLRQAVARYLLAMRDIRCQPEQVIITAGSRDAMALIAEVLLHPGDRVLLEDPCYPPLRQGLDSAGMALAHCPVDQQGMVLPPVDQRARLAWMTPSRQYPLGVTMSVERRLQWLARSHQQDCWLIEDDYDSEYHYRKTPLAPLFSLSRQQRVILAGSFSKLMFRTLRIGYLIVPTALVERFVGAQQRLGTLASVPVQPALAEFLGHRRFASHLRRMRRCYQARRDFLHQLLHERLDPQLQVQLPDRGMHLLALLKPGADLSDRRLEQLLARQQIYAPALSPHFHHANAASQGLVLGFSGSAEADLARGVDCLSGILESG